MLQQLKGGRFKRTLKSFRGLIDYPSLLDFDIRDLSTCSNFEAKDDGTMGPIGYYDYVGSCMVKTTAAYTGYGFYAFNPGYVIPAKLTVSAVSNDGSGNCRVTCGSVHGIGTEGGYVFMTGFTTNTSYNGFKQILNVHSTTALDIDETYISDDHTGGLTTACELTGGNTDPLMVIAGDGGYISFTTEDNPSMADNVFDIGTGHYPNFYDYGGNLRMSFGPPNGAAAAPEDVKWFGYVRRSHFTDATKGACFHDTFWYGNAELEAPTAGLAGEFVAGTAKDDAACTSTNLRCDDASGFADYNTELDKGTYIAVSVTDAECVKISARVDDDDLTTQALSGIWRTDVYAIHPPAGSGFCVITALSPDAASTWNGEEIEFASSFIYDGNQESLLFEMPGTFTVTAGNKLLTQVKCTRPFGPRVSGGRIYCREAGTNDQWKLLLEIDLDKGVKQFDGVLWSKWQEISATISPSAGSTAVADVYLTQGSGLSGIISTFRNPPNTTYESLNGFSTTEESLRCPAHRCSCVVMNRAFVSDHNVLNTQGSHDLVYGSIRYSELGKLDTFPVSRELVLGDCMSGKRIIAMVPFQNKIVALSTDAVAIINVESTNPADWYVQYIQMNGITRKAQATLTEYGVAWVSVSAQGQRSIYLYNGSEIKDLLIEQGNDGVIRRKLSSTYLDYLADTTIIGYDGISKKILLIFDGSNWSGTGLTLSLINNSIAYNSRGQDIGTPAGNRYSNFITRYGRAVIARQILSVATGQIYPMVWVDTPRVYDSATEMDKEGSFKTAFDDFEVPGLTKKIYAVSILYKLADSVAHTTIFRYSINGATTNLTTGIPSGTLTNASVWTWKRFEFTTPVQCNSFCTRFYAASEKYNLWIDQIVIEGRVIHKRIGE